MRTEVAALHERHNLLAAPVLGVVRQVDIIIVLLRDQREDAGRASTA